MTDKQVEVKKRGGQPVAKGFSNNKRKQKKFLTTLAKTFNVSASAKAAGVAVPTIYAYANRCPEFKQAMEEARAEACEEAQGEAYRRGVEGVDEPVYYQGVKVGTIRRYSDKMLELVLKGNMPEIYGNKSTIDVSMEAEVHVSAAKTKLLSMLGVNSLDEIEDAEAD